MKVLLEFITTKLKVLTKLLIEEAMIQVHTLSATTHTDRQTNTHTHTPPCTHEQYSKKTEL